MQRLVLALYQIIGTLLLPLLILALLIRSRRQPEYRSRLFERLGFCSLAKSKNGIIIHGASLGEITSLKPFIIGVIKALPDTPITVTSFTPAGSKQIKHLFGDSVNHTYLPVDSIICNWLFLKRLKPTVAIFMETELWPSLCYQLKKRNAKLLLINARLSEKSTIQYQKISPLIKLTLNQFDEIQAQTSNNADRFLSLGANSSKVSVKGNLKFDIAMPADLGHKISNLKKTLDNRVTWVIGSSHIDEEDLLLDVFQVLKKQLPHLLLLLAPRHPERYRPLEQKFQQRHLTYKLRSEDSQISNDTDIWLIDTIGELLLFYAVGDICTVAGSFDNTGGHNALEPALFGKAITVGPNTFGILELNQALLKANALLQHDSLEVEKISNDLLNLFNSKQRQKELGHNSNCFLIANRGATQSAISTLQSFIELN